MYPSDSASSNQDEKLLRKGYVKPVVVECELGIDHLRVSIDPNSEEVEENTTIKVGEEEGDGSAEIDDTESVTVEKPISVHDKEGE